MDVKDLVVIGGGPAGYEVAIKAACAGLSVTLIEKDEIGGTCLNHGCIPTKALYHNAHFLKELKNGDDLGVMNLNYNFDFSKVQSRKKDIINQLKHNINQLLNKTNVEVIKGFATFVDQTTIKVKTENDEKIVYANNFIIATGSTEKIIPIPGYNNEKVLTSKELLDIEVVPKKIVVIGGGVIGVEMASIFKEFGSEVVIIEYMDRIIPLLEEDLSSRLKVYMKKSGIEVYTDMLVEKIENNGDKLVVKAKSKKGKDFEVDTEYVLMSTGRVAYYDNLGLDNINVMYDKKGIIVNDSFQTSVENIYAVGDVLGKSMLAHTATFQSFKALDHILNKENLTNFKVNPSCVFTFPEIASVGMTEIEAKATYGDIKVNKFMYRANGKALTMGESEGFVKVIAHNDKLIGAHIIGPQASTIIHEATIIIEKELNIHNVVSVIHAHPTLSEALLEALKGFCE